MKKNKISIALVAALVTMAAAQASEFNGGYIGGKIGYNNNSPATAVTSNKAYAGGEIGYGWDVNTFMLGVDGFGDSHSKSVTGKDYGADVKLGYPMGKWMPYAKLGVTGTQPGTRPNAALGVEYKFAPHWSVLGEVFADSKSVNGVSQKNTNAAIGVNYYFGAPYVAPVVAAVAAPVVAKQAEPVAAPVVAQAPVVVAPAPVVAPVPAPVAAPKVYTLKGTNFATGSAKLMPAATAQMAEVLDFAAHSKEGLKIVGHTDSRGKEAANLRLSASRAAAVKAYLVKHGVDAKRIVTEGKGSADPVGDNKTDAGRAANRRVEVTAIK